MNRIRSTAALGICTAGLVAGAVALAPIAAADTNQYTVPISASDPTTGRVSADCGGSGGSNYHYVVLSATVPAGGNYTYYDVGYFDSDSSTIDSYVSFYTNGTFNPANLVANCVDSGDDSTTMSFPSGGTYTMIVSTFSSGVTGQAVFTLQDILLMGLSSGPGAPPPADAVQQVGMPAGGSCDAIDDKAMSEGTGLTGGWSASWAQWPHDGQGGAVCTRTLHYSTQLAQWVVAS